MSSIAIERKVLGDRWVVVISDGAQRIEVPGTAEALNPDGWPVPVFNTPDTRALMTLAPFAPAYCLTTMCNGYAEDGHTYCPACIDDQEAESLAAADRRDAELDYRSAQ